MGADKKYRLRFEITYGGIAYLWADNDAAKEAFDFGSIQNKLPLSDAMTARGIELSEWFQHSLDWSYPPDLRPWRQEECDRFKIAVRAFFEDLKAELGEDYELVYRQIEPDETPDLDEYLKDPKNFRCKW